MGSYEEGGAVWGREGPRRGEWEGSGVGVGVEVGAL